ncbi:MULTISPECIES: N-acetylmuramoyl-L-alanine amidase CwlD [Caloramator]|uniref:N-acetylmuramoyl-L-alanine amidase n=1 Tax=Caloramator proteoclasticus DSM 10124 TaxID=1121262 RepID=A0A1M4VT79_9CLOT|nr:MULTISPECIES: N-acetylmuramoyl-L-alanine amidase CwlD [Caloramator]SHE72060.1 N-acetylmuramoyl-L-alanine amidase [Caloramator proteoclasticus DSM 10124]
MLKRYIALIIVITIGIVLYIKLPVLGFNTNKVVIIDAGHGGIDPGAIGRDGTIEKDINLNIAQKLKGYLEDAGYTCIMIREIDEGLYSEYGRIRDKKNEDLRNRKQFIKKYKADLFISIHLNFFPESQYYGAQVFYPKNDTESEKIAKLIQQELIKTLNRGNKREAKGTNDIYVIRDNQIPSILIECGFLSNYEEEQLLKSEIYQNKIAWAIFKGISSYYLGNSK